MNRYRTRLAALPLALLLLLALPQTGCGTSKTAQGAVIGAGTGAVVGGVIGRATGSTARGAIIGAAVGGTAGAIIGRQMEEQAEELDDDLENATVETISDPETGETAGIAIRFDNALLFDLNSANLRPGVRADLADLASSLRTYDNHDAVIVGHASTDGPADYNQDLSERRAAAVEDYLASLGVASYRLQSYGRGESEPLAGIPGTSPDNRRVEIAIYANEEYRQNLQNEYGN
ncbi:MAG: OmpA family protein [Rubricoccaceae bacterium]|nr:OmpA family protein [Rubricoccaceae bacterium]